MDAARNDQNYGRGVASVSHGGWLSPEEVGEDLRRVFGAPDYHPPVLPAVALEVHGLVKRADVGIPEVVSVIEHDAMLAAEVLRVASSAAYATKMPPRSLQDAAARLGLSGLRDVVWQVAMGKVFRVQGYERTMDGLRKHSVAVATLTRLVASHTSVAMEYGFLLGLLHDVGLVAMIHALAERGATPPDLGDLAVELDAYHCEAGETVARLWGLPVELQWMIGAHRHPDLGGFRHPVIACECLAHYLADQAGRGPGLPGQHDTVSPDAVDVALAELRISERDLVRLGEEGRALLE